jgi:transcription elongation factor GreA
MQEKIVTPAGLKKYQDELDLLKNVKRREIAGRVQAAKEQGDLSENAEYAAAKDEQAYVEGRIEQLESILKTVKVVERENRKDAVGIGSKVTVKVAGASVEYEIVGANEADPSGGKISNESAVGQSLLGKKKGDKITVATPGGPVQYEIIAVA